MDNSFCLHLNESAYIGDDTHVRGVQVSVGILRKNISLKRNAGTTKSTFGKPSTMLKAKELRSSAVRAFRVNILPNLNLLSAENERNRSAGKF